MCKLIHAKVLIQKQVQYLHSQVRKSKLKDAVAMVADDTDVVLAAYVSHQIENVLGIEQKEDICNGKTLCLKKIAHILIPLHIHVGVDGSEVIST